MARPSHDPVLRGLALVRRLRAARATHLGLDDEGHVARIGDRERRQLGGVRREVAFGGAVDLGLGHQRVPSARSERTCSRMKPIATSTTTMVSAVEIVAP